jgi:transcriptional regulator with XRE-family HTH domain
MTPCALRQTSIISNISPMEIGQIIREIREARGATLEEIAFAADTNASNLSRIERGKQGYSVDSLERIGSALGVTVAELYLRADAANSSPAKSSKSSPATRTKLTNSTIAANRYSALNQENRELTDEFMALLLRRQRAAKI